jgi:lipopolysaccharide biosynthesis protein
MRAIAFYLPQYHPIPENDEWWGTGFTEWTNVRKTKPLFRDHQQPKIPTDLGYYDLRDDSARKAQADLARASGISGFCYWHYWFAGRRLLERPFAEVLKSGEPDFPFCLGWANESWAGVWHGNPDQILMQQSYPGAEDEERHFRLVEEAFKDPRYLTIDDKPIFYIYKPRLIPESQRFVDHWQNLAIKVGLKGVYFIGEDVLIDEDPWDYKASGFDAVVPNSPGVAFLRLAKKRFYPRYLFPRLIHKFAKHPVLHRYADFIEHNLVDPGHDDFYPSVVPNWDNTPRVGRNGFVLTGLSPDLFRQQLQQAVSQVENRKEDHRLIFVKSWNEWAEGNYLEPDLELGHAYLDVCKDVLGN